MNKTRRRKCARRHRANQIAYLDAWRMEMMAAAVEIEPGVYSLEFGALDGDDGLDEHCADDDIPF